MNRSSFAHEIAPTRVEMECVADTKSIVGESPLWSPAEQCVYFVDIPQRRLHRLNVGNMMLECFSTPDIVTAVALRRGGGLILTFERTLAFFDLATKSFDAVIDMTTEPTGNRFNDGKCDRQRRFWAGTMRAVGRTVRLNVTSSILARLQALPHDARNPSGVHGLPSELTKIIGLCLVLIAAST